MMKPPNIGGFMSFKEALSKVWSYIVQAATWAKVKLFSPLGAGIVVLAALALAMYKAKAFNVGGLLGGSLLGGGSNTGGSHASNTPTIDLANSVPKDRATPEGKVIPVGEPDLKGWTQAPVEAIDEPGIFEDGDHVTVGDTDAQEEITVKLPQGVESSDVAQVVVVKPTIDTVTVVDNGKVSPQEVGNLLKKYRR